jgi:hypothetical protein
MRGMRECWRENSMKVTKKLGEGDEESGEVGEVRPHE